MGRGGAAISFQRLQTSLSKLKIDWKTATARGEEKLSVREALDQIAKRDARPVLILREKERPDEKVEALLKATLKSERIQLASDWFYCVKVPEHASDPEHPWSVLFDDRHPERIVLYTRDGGCKVGFLGSTRHKVNWKGFARVLKKDYKRDATRAVKQINQLLSKYDAIDSRKKDIQEQLDRAKEGSDKRKIQKYNKKLEELEKELKKALRQEEKLRDLGLKRQLEQEKAAKRT
ncbi:MAG: hypothetical protein CSA62_14270 [Planctomycetota bacterium]|nr:MAG: hypothetical protein CSA62_14270 [Planctomycetota bacterium]